VQGLAQRLIAQRLIAEPPAANRCTPEVATEREQHLITRACGDAGCSPTIDLGDRQLMITPHPGHDAFDVLPQGTATPRQRSHRPGPRPQRRPRRRPPRSALSIALLSSNLPTSPSSLSGGADTVAAVPLMRDLPSSPMHPRPSAENPGKHATQQTTWCAASALPHSNATTTVDSIAGARPPGHRGARTQHGRAIPPGTTSDLHTLPSTFAGGSCLGSHVLPSWQQDQLDGRDGCLQLSHCLRSRGGRVAHDRVVALTDRSG